MGNFNVLPSHTDFYLHDLPAITFKHVLNDGRFMKTVECLHDEGPVVVKVYLKRDGDPDFSTYRVKLQQLKDKLTLFEHPNVAPFAFFDDTDKAAYLIRQFFYSNLHDRITIRPFLSTVEKKWITFQLINAVDRLHKAKLCHGDIKTENVLLTTYNWVSLSDFASFKPTFLQVDQPADFSYFFDTSGRRTCYLAPERFQDPSPGFVGRTGALKPSMDVFSLGCTIAELWLDGQPLFTFSTLLEYRKGKYDPSKEISKISDQTIASMVKGMLVKNNTSRKDISHFLSQARKAFPSYFEYLHTLQSELMLMSPDQKFTAVYKELPAIMSNFELDYKPIVSPRPTSPTQAPSQSRSGRGSAKNERTKTGDKPGAPLKDIQSFIKRLETEKDRASKYGGVTRSEVNGKSSGPDTASTKTLLKFSGGDLSGRPPEEIIITKGPTGGGGVSGAVSEFKSPGLPSSPTSSRRSGGSGRESGTTKDLILLVDVLSSSLRNLSSASTKVAAMEMLVSNIGPHLDSQTILARFVPYFVSMLTDTSPLVRGKTVGILTRLLDLVGKIPASEAGIFPDYILPALSQFSSDPDVVVRILYASNLAQLAEISRRYMDYTKLHGGKKSSNTSPADKAAAAAAELQALQESFASALNRLLTDPNPFVQRTVLMDISRFAIFFGREKTNDFLLPLLMTIMNSNDWEVRASFMHNIVGIGAFVGKTSLEAFVFPFFLAGLVDVEESVIEKTLNALSALTDLKLFRKHTLLDIAERTAPLVCHPNQWIRYATIAFYASFGRTLSSAEINSFLVPLLSPFLKREVTDVKDLTLLAAIKTPIARTTYDRALKVFSSPKSPTSPGSGGILNSSKKNKGGSRQFITSNISEDLPSEIFEMSQNKEDEEKLKHMKSYLLDLAHNVNAKSRLGILPESKRRDEAKDMEPYEKLETVAMLHELVGSSSSKSRRSVNKQTTIALSPSISKTFVSSIPSPLDLGELSKAPVSSQHLRAWRPKGVLVAHLHEHKAAVNRLVVSADNMFFASGSEDGSVKIWDSARFESNPSNRSQATYSSQTGPITDITVCHHTHSVASASSDGSVHIFRVDHKANNQRSLSSSLATVKVIDLKSGPVVGVSHFSNDSSSPLLAATLDGTIHAYDLRSKRSIWSLSNASNLGYITSFTTDPSHSYLVCGSSRGYFSVFDIRFQVPMKIFGHPSKSVIHRIITYPKLSAGSMSSPKKGSNAHISSSSEPLVIAACGKDEASVWNIEKNACTQIFRVLSRDDKSLISKAATGGSSLPPRRPPALNDYGVEDLKKLRSQSDRAIHALYSTPGSSYFVTGGTSPGVRYWDLSNPQASYTIAGLEPGDSKPRYTSQLADNKIPVTLELPADSGLPTTSDTSYINDRRGPSRASPNHQAGILDITALEIPHRMLLTAGRDGIVKVWR